MEITATAGLTRKCFAPTAGKRQGRVHQSPASWFRVSRFPFPLFLLGLPLAEVGHELCHPHRYHQQQKDEEPDHVTVVHVFLLLRKCSAARAAKPPAEAHNE